MSAAERLAAVKAQLEALKQRIRGMQRAKEDEIDWETYGKPSTVTFNFQTRRSLQGHFGKVYALDWSSEPNIVLSASQDGKLIIWNAFTQYKKAAISLKSNWVMTCAYEKDTNRFVACGGLDSVCSIYEVSAAGGVGAGVGLPIELSGHDGYLSSCKFLEPGRMLTSSGDSTCALWDISEGKGRKLQTFSDHSADVMRCVCARVCAAGGHKRAAEKAAGVWMRPV
jgi:guanine nucleotide-binding protein G(I)/G(S)/G(T) subunit beta-1